MFWRVKRLTKYSYTTRLGPGGFPTEDTGEVGGHLQELGGEYAALIRRKLRVSIPIPSEQHFPLLFPLSRLFSYSLQFRVALPLLLVLDC